MAETVDITIDVSRELKKRMDAFPGINWSQRVSELLKKRLDELDGINQVD